MWNRTIFCFLDPNGTELQTETEMAMERGRPNATNPWRCSLLMALTVCLGGVFICEQPRQSLLYRHPRFRWLTTICTAPRFEYKWFHWWMSILDYLPWILQLWISEPRFSEAVGGCVYSSLILQSDMWHTPIPHGSNASTWVGLLDGNPVTTRRRTLLFMWILFPGKGNGMEPKI